MVEVYVERIGGYIPTEEVTKLVSVTDLVTMPEAVFETVKAGHMTLAEFCEWRDQVFQAGEQSAVNDVADWQ